MGKQTSRSIGWCVLVHLILVAFGLGNRIQAQSDAAQTLPAAQSGWARLQEAYSRIRGVARHEIHTEFKNDKASFTLSAYGLRELDPTLTFGGQRRSWPLYLLVVGLVTLAAAIWSRWKTNRNPHRGA